MVTAWLAKREAEGGVRGASWKLKKRTFQAPQEIMFLNIRALLRMCAIFPPTRNTYDVGIDPFMHVFAGDNTNDGGG